jgi:L-serine dehydratase
MRAISIFEMLSIGVGPSSSHTLGPWRAALELRRRLQADNIPIDSINQIQIELYGSLSLTGKGHYTDKAIICGLSALDYESVSAAEIESTVERVSHTHQLNLFGEKTLSFDPSEQLIFHKTFLPHHPNALTFSVFLDEQPVYSQTFYSLGGGFISSAEEVSARIEPEYAYTYPSQSAKDLLNHCISQQKKISDIVLENEKKRYSENYVHQRLDAIYQVMRDCAYKGCHSGGYLPGRLQVKRRAFDMHKSLIKEAVYSNPDEWIASIRKTKVYFREILKWVSCFAIAVNEENAAMGRVVTAPTNGSAGVVPAVLLYYLVIENHRAGTDHIRRFLCVAAEIGTLFKKNATISAAMGGCQAEIGVSSAMAAAALTELMGGDVHQVLTAAEIAMEHHLGLTCDPIGGLVQIPCIERNSMGAIKAINAAELALGTQKEDTRVSLDEIIATMWDTAKDMNAKYKETSTGGLAVKVNQSDC